MRSSILLVAGATCLGLAAPACAQDTGVPLPSPPTTGASVPADPAPPNPAPGLREATVFDGDYLTVGVGAVYSPSYLGSDDYVITPFPLVRGSVGGIDIDPRGAGLGLTFVTAPLGGGAGLDLGLVARLRSDRAARIEDEVVESLGELDRAIEVGSSAGVNFAGLLNPYDSLSFTGDLAWDVAGAHEGMVATPTVSYFTPLSQSMAATLSLSAEYGDGRFLEYYFRVSPQQSAATGGVLPAFEPGGGGFTSAGGGLLLAFDLNGNLADGGWALAVLGSYSRTLGDARRSPFTSMRGSADQFMIGGGIGYTF